ncbi:thioredoxin domain-containing protein [Actinocorallia sp. A-T 12471]|uniref:thioredoxin domain-containing protein n=1 Tax=Actinocorallia sp. A-T 12471 TaxID=3089813 RepID=UPI0029CBD448|nr:thioredoxin domain-containing protein [Actinocorallia sp. A-T 12471]MDX6738579.1 thioredoxin domain-containing protein [Actinocorallia sp. A-T 12471]
MNRLAGVTSPYLLQHAGNPVDWWPWGEEAFAEARGRGVPVLLSVGYAACHWCHVMAHESFEDVATAELMNESFVCVKVDREERPDVDAVYMEAVQALTGQGGWPMTVFMTPDGHPFYCGTYFPRERFQGLLRAVSTAWREQREELVAQGRQIVDALGGQESGLAAAGAPDDAALDRAVQVLARGFDEKYAGFGQAPKFPPSMVLEFLLRRGDAGRMGARTLEAMARGGIYDQLGGGFARYSVDAAWVVPHFEKMLYDNALLARVYAHWWRKDGAPLARRVALETCDWMLRELGTDEGGLASALDADSEGVEGKFYVWTPAQLAEVLGEEDGARAARAFRVTERGTFEHGSSTLQLEGDLPEDLRERLFQARAERVRPARDDKVVAAWNGLAIAALAECGALFDRPDLIDAARGIADLIERLHVADGRLLRTSRDGVAGANAGVLEDYADVAEGLLALHSVTGEPEYVTRAGVLLDVVLDRFSDGEGGFYDTADDAEALFRRPKDPTDNATPSGQSAAAGALLTYAALTGSQRHRDAALAALAPSTALADRHARFAGWGLAVAAAAVRGPVEVAVVGDPDDRRTRELHRTALMSTSPGAVVTVGLPGQPLDGPVPLLGGRDLLDDAPAAYVCRDFACRMPVGTSRDLAKEIASS